jgi:23S rRNA pseudouridine2604 synthase
MKSWIKIHFCFTILKYFKHLYTNTLHNLNFKSAATKYSCSTFLLPLQENGFSMPIRNILHYILIKKLHISKKEALRQIENGAVRINSEVVTEDCYFQKTDEIKVENVLLQEGKKLLQIAFYKPRGIETTLNEGISDNLKQILPFEQHLYPIGRLDKESEGLLLLTNDGQLYRELNHYGKTVEKEYIVEISKTITADFLEKMATGVEILGKTTLPCLIHALNDTTFSIILTQGLNRQIRRMCYKLDCEVISLKRIRIGTVTLGDLEAGEWREVQ